MPGGPQGPLLGGPAPFTPALFGATTPWIGGEVDQSILPLPSSNTPAMQQPPFAVRIVSIDYYLAPPVPSVDVCYSPLEGTAVEQVPVVRVFGATPAGQKACLHVHRVRNPACRAGVSRTCPWGAEGHHQNRATGTTTCICGAASGAVRSGVGIRWRGACSPVWHVHCLWPGRGQAVTMISRLECKARACSRFAALGSKDVLVQAVQDWMACVDVEGPP